MRNFTKKILVALFLLPLCFQARVMASEENEPQDIPVVAGQSHNPGNTPGPKNRARARYIAQEPKCFYYEGEVTIQADNTVSYITAEIIRAEDNMTWSDAGVGNTITMTVTSDPGTYYLYFTLSNGKSYIGKYILY